MMYALFQPVYAVWYRQVKTYTRLWGPVLANNVANPLLFLFSFGFGLGAVIPVILDSSGYEMSYLHYVVPGMLVYTVMFAASFESSISAFSRMTMQQTWNAILATPVSLGQLLMGEVLWASTKAMIAALAVLIAAYFFDGLPSGWGSLWTLPVVFLGAFVFSTFGLLSSAYAKSFDHFSYFFTFWITPMFMFGGVFFPVDRFPEYIAWVSYIFPITYVLDIARPISADVPLALSTVLKSGSVLVLMAVVTYALAYRKIKARLLT